MKKQLFSGQNDESATKGAARGKDKVSNGHTANGRTSNQLTIATL